MKKIAILLAVLMMGMLLLTGCSGKAGGKDGALKADQSVQAIVSSIAEELGIPMAAEVDDMMLNDIFYIDPADTASYAGQFAMVNVSSANVIVVEAKDADTVASIQESLEKRKQDMVNSFEMYLPDQYDIATNGKVLTKGSYVALLMIENVDRAEEIFNAAFES